MHNVDLVAAKAAKASDRKTLAILAYDNGCADPAGANWHGIADLLRLAIPATKAKASAELGAATNGAPSWSDYDIPANATKKLGKSPIVTVTFACGAVVRAPAVSLPGKPVNIGRGLRVAFAFYRARIARAHANEFAAGSDCVNIPPIVSAICDSGAGFDPAEYDAAELNSKSAAWRLGEYDAVAVAVAAEAYPVTAEAGELTRAEFLRARYRLAMLGETIDGAEGEYIRLRISGMTKLEIDAQFRAAEAEERKAAKARRARVAAYMERRAARSELALPEPAELGLDMPAATEQAESLPVAPLPDALPVAPCYPAPAPVDDFEAMRQSLKQGVKVVSAPQLFPTPANLVAEMFDAAEIEAGQTLLEPSAGTGALVRPAIERGALVTAIEINSTLARALHCAGGLAHGLALDFLEFAPTPEYQFDRILMNPPFERGADIKHIEHARKFLKPGGRLVAICADGPRQRERLQPIASEYRSLPAGSFKASGTMVNTAIVVIEGPPG